MARESFQDKSLVGDRSADNSQPERYIEQISLEQDAINKSQQRTRSSDQNKSKVRGTVDSYGGSLERPSSNKLEEASSNQREQQNGVEISRNNPNNEINITKPKAQNSNKKSVNNTATIKAEAEDQADREQESRRLKENTNTQSSEDVQSKSNHTHSSPTSQIPQEKEVRVFSFSDRLDDPDSARYYQSPDKMTEILQGDKPQAEGPKKTSSPSVIHTNESSNIHHDISQSSRNQSESPQKNKAGEAQEQNTDNSNVESAVQSVPPQKKETSQQDPLKKLAELTSQNMHSKGETVSENVDKLKMPGAAHEKESEMLSSIQNSSTQKKSIQTSPNLKRNQFIKVDEDFNLEGSIQSQGHPLVDDSSEVDRTDESSTLQEQVRQRSPNIDSFNQRTSSANKQSSDQIEVAEFDAHESSGLDHNASSSDKKDALNQKGSSHAEYSSAKKSRSEAQEDVVTPSKDSNTNKSLTNYKSFDNTPNINAGSERSPISYPVSRNSPEKNNAGVSQNRSPEKASGSKTVTVSEAGESVPLDESNSRPQGSPINDSKLRSPVGNKSVQSEVSMKSAEKNNSFVKDRLDQDIRSEVYSQNSVVKDRGNSLLHGQGQEKPSNTEIENQNENEVERFTQERSGGDVDVEINRGDIQRANHQRGETKKKNHIPGDSEERANYNPLQDEASDRNERIRSILQGNTDVFNEQGYRGRNQALSRGASGHNQKVEEGDLQTITEENSSAVNQKQAAHRSSDSATNDKDLRSLSNILQDEAVNRSISKKNGNLDSDGKSGQREDDLRGSDSYEKSAVNQSQKSQSHADEHHGEDASESRTPELRSQESSPYKTAGFSHLRGNYNGEEGEIDAPSFKDRHFEQTFGRGSSKIGSSEPSQAQIKTLEGTPNQDKEVRAQQSRNYVDPSELLIKHFKSSSPRPEGGDVEQNYEYAQEQEQDQDQDQSRGNQTAKFGRNLISKPDDNFDQQDNKRLSPIEQSIIRTNKMKQSKGSFGGKTFSPSEAAESEGHEDLVNADTQIQGEDTSAWKGKDLQDIQKEINNTLKKNSRELISRFNQTPEPVPEESHESSSKQKGSASKKSGSPNERLHNVYNKQSRDSSPNDSPNKQAPGPTAKKTSPVKDNAPRKNQWAARSTIEEGPGQEEVNFGKNTKNFAVYNLSPKTHPKEASRRDEADDNSDNEDRSQVLSAYSKDGSQLAEKESEAYTSQYAGRELELLGSALSEDISIKE